MFFLFFGYFSLFAFKFISCSVGQHLFSPDQVPKNFHVPPNIYRTNIESPNGWGGTSSSESESDDPEWWKMSDEEEEIGMRKKEGGTFWGEVGNSKWKRRSREMARGLGENLKREQRKGAGMGRREDRDEKEEERRMMGRLMRGGGGGGGEARRGECRKWNLEEEEEEEEGRSGRRGRMIRRCRGRIVVEVESDDDGKKKVREWGRGRRRVSHGRMEEDTDDEKKKRKTEERGGGRMESDKDDKIKERGGRRRELHGRLEAQMDDEEAGRRHGRRAGKAPAGWRMTLEDDEMEMDDEIMEVIASSEGNREKNQRKGIEAKTNRPGRRLILSDDDDDDDVEDHHRALYGIDYNQPQKGINQNEKSQQDAKTENGNKHIEHPLAEQKPKVESNVAETPTQEDGATDYQPINPVFAFNPPNEYLQERFRQQLSHRHFGPRELENKFERFEVGGWNGFAPTMMRPDRVKQIEADGNCMFRAISYALTGTEKLHMEVRWRMAKYCAQFVDANGEERMRREEPWMGEMVLDNREEPAHRRNAVRRPQFARIRDYVHYIAQPNVWGDAAELVVAAKTFGVNIVTFYVFGSAHWLCYSPRTQHEYIGTEQEKELPTLFLEYFGENHYNVVLSVKEPTRATKEMNSALTEGWESENMNLFK